MKKLIQQLSRFVLIGGLATVIDFAVLALVYRLLGWHYLIAGALGFTVATVFNYWASMAFVFESRYAPSEKQKEFTLFLALSLAGLGLNQLLLYGLVDLLGLGVFGSKLIATAFVTLFNFISRKLLLEKQEG